MRAWLILLFLSVECILRFNCYKLNYPDSLLADHYIQSRSRQLPVLFPANRQDGGYYDDIDDSTIYRRTLKAIAETAAAAEADVNQDYQIASAELNSEELLEPINDDVEIKADPRDEESESHSSLVAGHQYVSGGAGEGKQHLQPDGSIPNKEEVKSDEDLPAYCDPPNPCPVGYAGEDCDSRSYSEFTAEFSKNYQEHQNCMCDDDHNDCKRSINVKSNDRVSEYIRNTQLSRSDDRFSAIVAKKSPRAKRDIQTSQRANPYLRGEAIKIHIAKKAVPS